MIYITKSMMVLVFSLLMLGGANSTALAQNGEKEEAAPRMDRGAMMEMMQNCPMMKDDAKRAELMEKCPMMTDGAEMDHAAMMKAMQNCPIMQKMMEDCPMMKGRMHHEGMQHEDTKHEGMKHEGMQHEGMQHEGHDARQQSSAAPAETVEGVQEVAVTVGPMGYDPKQIELKAGVPARLTFTRTADGGCTHQIQSPALGIEKTDLPLNEPVTFDVTPTEEGAFTFACGMNMMKGTIIVKR